MFWAVMDYDFEMPTEFHSAQHTLQARMGSATPMAMKIPPQALLNPRPARANQGRIRLAALASINSAKNSVITKVAAMMTNWCIKLFWGSRNCGKKALKNNRTLGLVIDASAPCRKSDQLLVTTPPLCAEVAIGGERHT